MAEISNKVNIAVADAKGVTQAPRKVSLVAALIRGRTVADALIILDHTPKRAALPVKKAILSAKANAANNHKLDEKSLIISELTVTVGTRLKRFRAGARGMAKPYQKKTSHIHVALMGDTKKATPKKAAAASSSTSPKKEEK